MSSDPSNWPPYNERQFVALEPLVHDGWTLKVHGIAARSERPSSAAEAAARRTARAALPTPARTVARYGVGFLVVHEGEDALWVLVHWWEEICLLHQRLFSAPLDDLGALAPVSSPTLVACTWELDAIDFERRAWLAAIRGGDLEASIRAYLADHRPVHRS